MSATGIEAGKAADLGRRARKKAATRAAIADAALRLFLDRGYRAVSIKDIADEADVAVTTVFQHFPSKEALVFDKNDEIRESLVAAVADREPDQPVLDALEQWALHTRMVRTDADPTVQQFMALVQQTEELDAYWRRLWSAHGEALADSLLAASDGHSWQLTPATARSLAGTVLDTCDLARGADEPASVITEVFDLIRGGWPH
jgi:AcrR family transcriptional regulator